MGVTPTQLTDGPYRACPLPAANSLYSGIIIRFEVKDYEPDNEDIKELFPFQEIFWSTDKEFFSSLFVSRKELSPYLSNGSMTTKKRIQGIPEDGPLVGVFQLWKRQNKKKALENFSASIPFFSDYANFDERLLSSYLNLLINGQIAVDSIPQLIEEKE